MAHLVLHSRSAALHMQRRLHVILPNSRRNETNLPWLLLLHGASSDASWWLRMTRAEFYAEQKGLALVLPDGENGFYTDMYRGYRYYDYLTVDVEADIQRYLPSLSQEQGRRYIAGLSMGGFGTLKYAVDFPERFAAAGAFSGMLDPVNHNYGETAPQAEPSDARYANAFGPYAVARDSANDLAANLRRALTLQAPLPALYFSCGRQDFLYANNRRTLAAFATAAPGTSPPLSACYMEYDAAHSWPFWDLSLAWFLDKIVPDQPALFQAPPDYAEWDLFNPPTEELAKWPI